MLTFVVIFIAIVSVFMAVMSLKKQNKLEEVKKAKKHLKKGKVIFYHSAKRA